jgi:beta-alanine--pyruvate transaminase
MSYDFTKTPNDLDAYWMPFTPQRMFKAAPRIVARAKGVYYYDEQGREILDGTAGLWCVNVGHDHPKMKEALKAQIDTMDFAHTFQLGHPTAFMAANRLVEAMPNYINHVFFSNSGSEAVDTALKIALAYHKAKGQPQRRVLIGRERGYHGVGFGGISVGGLSYNRKAFGSALLSNVDHIPHTLDLEHNAFSRGQPAWGAHLADDLERRILWLHDPDNVAAVIIEPVAGSTGVLPPPVGYLERIRAICDKYGILLIFDEVITAFGRFGSASSADYFGVKPDIICTAKGLTNGAVPMGATFVTGDIYNAFMQGPENVTEFMHGYTYSGHPLACAAAIATQDIIRDEGVYAHAKSIMQSFEDAIHSLRGLPRIVDIRNCGILGAVDFEMGPADDPYKWPRAVMIKCFEQGVMVRFTGNSMAISPAVVMKQAEIERIVETVAKVMKDL